MEYYYDDPLKAAYMAREFGLKYEESRINKIAIERKFDGARATDWLKPTAYTSITDAWIKHKFYVHPECYGLLEAQEGDMVTNIGMSGWLIISVKNGLLYDAHGSYTRPNEARIILRGDKPFFMPDIELSPTPVEGESRE